MNARLFKGIFTSLCLMQAPLATNLAENGQGNDEPTPKGEETKTPFRTCSQARFYSYVNVEHLMALSAMGKIHFTIYGTFMTCLIIQAVRGGLVASNMFDLDLGLSMRIEVYPRYTVYLQFHEFFAIDLVHGFYQVRFRLRPDLEYEFDDSIGEKENNIIYDQQGLTRPIKIAFNEQNVELKNSFWLRIKGKKRYEKCETFFLHFQVELWYSDPEQKPSPHNFQFMSKRLVSVRLNSNKSTHCHRAVFFEYFSFSAASMTVHACVTGLETALTKTTPAPPGVPDKLRRYHRQVCSKLLDCTLSLQMFIKTYESLLSSPLCISCIDVDEELGQLTAKLLASKSPWTTFSENAKLLALRLGRIFHQLVQLYGQCRRLHIEMLEKSDQQRMKRFAEGFYFIEETVQNLLECELNQASRIFDLVRKDGYLTRLPTVPVTVDGTDVEGQNVTLIVERRYLPSGATKFSRAIPLAVHSTSCLPALASDELTVQSAREPVRPRENRSSNASMEKLHLIGFCFPVARSKVQDDDAYGLKEELAPPDDRLSKRRMTDPGEIHQLLRGAEEVEDLPNYGNKTQKSYSVAEIRPNTANDVTTFASTSNSSTDSLTRSARGDIHESVQMRLIDRERVHFMEAKECFKQRLHHFGFTGNLYSDQNYFTDRKAYFSDNFSQAIERRSFENLHLIVLVHGLEGTSEDLTTYKNYLQIALPEQNFSFLLSEVNQNETWSDLQKMGSNLLKEINRYVDRLPRLPEKISLIAHSLGGLIVRAMCGLNEVQRLESRFHTLLTLNSPHCGVLYNQRAASLGISLLQWWKQSVSLDQLTLRDARNPKDTFLYRLGQNKAFGMFKHVLLVGSHLDLYVPLHSALVENCKAAAVDSSVQGNAYNEMLAHINESIIGSPKHTTLIKYTVSHSLTNVSRAQQMTGRPMHIAVVDDDTFVEKLMMVSASNYFK
ncbi:unnamed protein product [Bursaphelenchus xylophilus]|uniref:(pine wood nematode) hypothetical protein n=1 Tax=Bursaphelenchus xylophilus TaxID=6326 RepID=A0A7I8XNX6_BURXY|nr:unnamed protein product [Bursaphelenchus xylophilus]CAG9080865.1 unnamed protein product [Bursaphelenchus xylophilus]